MNKIERQRARVVKAAESWLNTPFHDCANLKGVGVDCANYLAQVYAEARVIKPVAIKPYSPQWFLHRSEELFLGYVFSAGGREIKEAEAQMGDAVMYQIGRCYAHGAIIIKWPEHIIHAHKASRAVVYSGGHDGDLVDAPCRFFTMW